jgi:hypothetical protein
MTTRSAAHVRRLEWERRRAKVLSIKQELLDLAAVREEAADNIEDRMPGRLTLAMRKVLAGPSGVRDRRAYNIAVERAEDTAIRT